MIILKIAFRNLLEHKAKTAIVGSLIAIAVIFMVSGNSIMQSITSGLKQSYSAAYTGDLIVHGISKESFSLIAMGGAASDIPQIHSYAELLKAARDYPHTEAVLPLVSGSATISVNEESAGFTQLWGTNLLEYRAMFPNSLNITEGAFPAKDGAYILLSETVRAEAEKETGKKISVGDKVTLGGFGSDGSRLREAEVAGIFHFERGSAQLERISLVDANTLRSLKGMTALEPSTQTTQTTPPEANASGAVPASSADVSEDDLFGNAGSLINAKPAQAAGTKTVNYDSILGDTSVRQKYSTADENAWNFLLVRLSDSSWYPEAKKALDGVIAKTGAESAVSDWQWGAGMVASLAVGIQLIFNIIILVILIVAVIIIMNTLVISVTERIPEIGTIRAIGGSRNFVRKMIVWETLTLSIASGLAGVAAGALLIATVGSVGIGSTNMFFQILFGGSTLHPVLSLSSVFWSLASTVLIGVLSSLYPTAIALKISPVRAMQKN